MKPRRLWSFFAGSAIAACSSPQSAPTLEAPPPAHSDEPVAPASPTMSHASPSPTTSASGPPPSADYAPARDAAMKGDCLTARRLLGPTVMNGRGVEEEVDLVKTCCRQMADASCVDALKKQYPRARSRP